MIRAAMAAAWLCAALPTHAADCRLALLLAMDVSSSVDPAEDSLQRNGLASALIAPEVQAAFFAADLPVALAVYEWSGRYNQELLLDWQIIRSSGDLVAVAERIGRSVRSQDEFPTAMGYALGYGAGLLNNGPICLNQTLDIAGDGENNEGFPPAAAYAEFPFDNVVVNGLVVNAVENEADGDVVAYYRDEVIRGPGAFLEIARGFEDYERALRRKLERELRPKVVGQFGGTRGAPG